MALNPEFGHRPEPLPHLNLRSEATVKKLLEEGRYPALSRLGSEDKVVECLIPGKGQIPSQTVYVSFDEAKEIAAVRSRLEREH